MQCFLKLILKLQCFFSLCFCLRFSCCDSVFTSLAAILSSLLLLRFCLHFSCCDPVFTRPRRLPVFAILVAFLSSLILVAVRPPPSSAMNLSPSSCSTSLRR